MAVREKMKARVGATLKVRATEQYFMAGLLADVLLAEKKRILQRNVSN